MDGKIVDRRTCIDGENKMSYFFFWLSFFVFSFHIWSINQSSFLLFISVLFILRTRLNSALIIKRGIFVLILKEIVCVCFFPFSIFFININASSQGASEMNTTRRTAIIGELDLPGNIHTHTLNIRLELTPKLFTVLAAFIISCACQKNWCYIRKADLFVDFFSLLKLAYAPIDMNSSFERSHFLDWFF